METSKRVNHFLPDDIKSFGSIDTFQSRYTAIEVTAIDRSIQFYTELLGMKTRSHKEILQTDGDGGARI
jgi:hypothetical protein